MSMFCLNPRSPRSWRAALSLAFALPLMAAPLDGASAQATGVVRGTVTMAGLGRPLPGAQVSIKGTQRGTLADASGAYVISGVSPGPAVVRVDMLGYKTTEQTVNVVAGATATANFQLNETAIGLDQIVVTGTTGRGQAKRTLGQSVSTVDAAKVTDAVPINNVQQLLQGRTPGVTMMNSTGV